MKIFQKRLLALTTIVLILFATTSCNKEDENEKVANDLSGTWTIQDTQVDLSVGGVDLVDYLVNEMELSQAEAQGIVDFYVNLIVSENQGSITFRDDNTYTFHSGGEQENGTWSVTNDGNTLTMTNQDGTDNLSILTLNSSTLIVELPTESEEVDMDGDDVAETTVGIDMEISFSR